MLTARMRVDNAALAVDRASIGVDDARLGLDESNFFAPFAGVLAEPSATLGGRVAGNEKLALLIDPQSIEVTFRVSDSQFGRLLNEAGTALAKLTVRVALNLGETQTEIAGVLDRVSAVVDSTRGGRLIFARLDLSDQSLIRPGDIVSVFVEEPPVDSVISLTTRSLVGDDSVYIVGADERIETRRVEIVRRQGERVLVRGLDAGTAVVINPLPQLGPGVKVRLNNPNVAARKSDNKTAKPGVSDDRHGADSNPEDLIVIDAIRRERLIAAVENNTRIPQQRRAYILSRLSEQQVPRQMVERIESRLGQ